MKEASIIKSGFWYTISSILVKGLAFFTMPIFTRIMSKSDIGDYSNYSSWLLIIGVIITIDLEASLVNARYDFEDKFDEYILSMLALSSLSTITLSIVTIVFSSTVSYLTGLETNYLIILFIYILFSFPITLFQYRQRFLNEYKSSVYTSLLVAFSTTLLSIALICGSEEKLTARIIGSLIPIVLLGTYFILYFIKKGKKCIVRYWRYALPICLPYIPHLLSLILLNAMDKVMITRYCGSEANALYSVSYTGGQIVTLLVSSLNMAYSPWLAEKINQKSFSKIRSNSYIYILVFSIFTVGLFLISPEALYFLGGSQYMEATMVLAPISMACVCQFFYTMYVNIEQITKNTYGMAFASISAAILNYVLNMIFIPEYGYVGAAYTTLVCYIWLFMCHMILVKRIGYFHLYNGKFVITVFLVLLLFSFMVNWLYQYDLLRYSILSLYGLVLIFSIYKFAPKLKSRFA